MCIRDRWWRTAYPEFNVPASLQDYNDNLNDTELLRILEVAAGE